MEPNVIAMSVDIVLQQQIQVPRSSILKDTVQVASFEVRGKRKRQRGVGLLQIMKGNDLIVFDPIPDVSNED